MNGLILSVTLVLSFGVILCSAEIDFDPYNALEVDRTASADEIKKAYRKQAKVWHPDKNKSPEAEEKFIQIQQAYGILSDSDKRHQFDTGGYSRSSGSDFNFNSFDRRDFSDFFANFQSSGNSQDLSNWNFESKVLPESYKTPQLLYIYSTFCGKCVVWLRTTWAKSSAEINKLGVETNTVDATFSSSIVGRIGVVRVPSVVGIYKGKYYHYKEDTISYNGLKNFVNSFLPKLITTVDSSNFESFIAGVEEDDKPRTVLFSPSVAPTLLYTLLAVKFERNIKFGFVTMGNPQTKNISQAFNVFGQKPTLFVFKESNSVPAVVVKASEMYQGAIDMILESNKFMTIPRITSKDVFDELCPWPDSASSDAFSLCMIHIVDKSSLSSVTMLENMRYHATQIFQEQTKEWIMPLHVDAGKQEAFVNGLCTNCVQNNEVILLQRLSEYRVSMSMHSLPALAIARTDDNSIQQERELNKFLQYALKILQTQNFDRTADVRGIVDELALPFFERTWNQMFDFVTNFVDTVQQMNSRSLMTYILGIGLALSAIGNLFGSPEEGEREPDEDDIIMDEINKQEKKKGDSKKTEENSKKTSSPKKENMASKKENMASKKDVQKLITEKITELTPHNYETHILSKKRGKLCILLLSDQTSAKHNGIVDMFNDAMKYYISYPSIGSLCYLDTSKYVSWYKELRLSSSPNPDGEGSSSDLHGQDTADDIEFMNGTVLAINGKKHWYCLFVPRHIDTMNSSEAHGEGSYEETLANWMDRVLEGQHPHLYLRQWPGLYSREEES